MSACQSIYMKYKLLNLLKAFLKGSHGCEQCIIRVESGLRLLTYLNHQTGQCIAGMMSYNITVEMVTGLTGCIIEASDNSSSQLVSGGWLRVDGD